ncbi:MAG TPA: glycosyltransferase family 39 protein, partial [Planctomycetota bacterium]
MPFPTGRNGWLWLLPAFALGYAWNLRAPELTPIDESRSAVIVRDMTEGGNWLLPRTPDGYLSEKPPLYYGLAAAASSLLGVSEWSLRGISVLMAVATLLMVGLTARLFGPPRASAIAVAVLGCNTLFTAWARSAMVDMTFTFFLTSGMAAYFAARRGRLGLWAAAALCGIYFGLAVLCKGPLGLALPVAGVLGDLLVVSRGRFWKAPVPWAAVGAALLITVEVSLLWYLPAALAGGAEFLHTSLLDENLYMPMGLSRGIAGSHAKPLWYYFSRQVLMLLPVAAILPVTFRWLFQRRSDPDRALLATWAGAGFLILMVASNKRWYYLLPLQPAVALMIAAALVPLWDADPAKWLRWGARAAGGLFAGVALAALGAVYLRPSLLESADEPRLQELVRDHRALIALALLVVAATGALMIAAGRGRS